MTRPRGSSTRRSRRIRPVVAVALLLLLAPVLAPRRAAAEPPHAQITGHLGLRFNVGPLGERYSWGIQSGAEASLMPWRIGTNLVRLGPAWWASITRNFAAAGAVDAETYTLHLGLGLRLAATLPVEFAPLTAHLVLGGQLLRASLPVPPDEARQYFGPSMAAGLSFGGGTFFGGVTVAHDLVFGGPAGVSVLLTAGFGSY